MAKKKKASNVDESANKRFLDDLTTFLRENGHLKEGDAVRRVAIAPKEENSNGAARHCVEWKTERTEVRNPRTGQIEIILNRVCVRFEDEE